MFARFIASTSRERYEYRRQEEHGCNVDKMTNTSMCARLTRVQSEHGGDELYNPHGADYVRVDSD
jgi:hypothetical protein